MDDRLGELSTSRSRREELARSRSRRESRIQGALETKRSASNRFLSTRAYLSGDEEAELEGKAGDTGSARATDSGRVQDGTGMLEDLEAEFGISADELRNAAALQGVKPSEVTLTPSQVELHRVLELVSMLSYLTTFGIMGVIIRFLLETLFGHSVSNVTSNRTALFIDLPANMLGSFFMGWVGVVFKKHIAEYSDHLAVGLSTGLMGSITTFAGMQQRMLALMVAGKWVPGLFGLLAGVYLAQMSLEVGVDSALLVLHLVERVNQNRGQKGAKQLEAPTPETRSRRMLLFLFFLFLGAGLWAAAAALSFKDKHNQSRRTLWLACLVGPPGVWVRWHFAKYNGRGLGRKHHLRWMPFGTLFVNVLASSIEAGLSCAQLAASNYSATVIVGAINLGTLGCMSTVSTFAAEIQMMHRGPNPWRAYVYSLLSVLLSLAIGICVYGVPVWVKGYKTL